MNSSRASPNISFEDRGAIGGVQSMWLGFAVCILGGLMIVNAWAVVDGWLAASAAAREGTRAFVESSPDVASETAVQRVEETIEQFGRSSNLADISVPPSSDFTRCATATVSVQYEVDFIVVPIFWDIDPGFTIEARHTELIDPYRAGDFEGSCSP